MRRIARDMFGILVMAAIVLLCGAAGLFAPLDNALRDLRFGWAERPATGDIVLVEIDPRSIQEFGVWPWPRSIHARLIDALIDYNAAEIAFDIDFSSRSTPEDDAAFAQALERAGGFVILAAFKQPVLTESGLPGQAISEPIDMLAREASPASVNVVADADGKVRAYPYAIELGNRAVPSLPAVLASSRVEEPESFLIDYSINASDVDRMAIVDVIEGRIEPARLRDKQVIVGAGAVELRDTFAVPRYGVLTGSMVQVLATETLVQGRVLRDLGPWPAALLTLLLGLYVLVERRRLKAIVVISTAVVTAVVVGWLSVWMQGELGLMVNSAGFYAAQLALMVGLLGSEVDLRGLIVRRTRKQFAATRAMLDQVIADHFDAVVVVNQDGAIVASSRPADNMLGAGASLVGNHSAHVLPSILAGPVAEALRAEGTNDGLSVEPVETTLRDTANGGGEIIIEFVVTASDVPGQDSDDLEAAERVVCLTFRDVTQSRRQQREIKYLADHDPLTGALSRTRLTGKIQEFLEVWSGDQACLTMVLVDLDRFKSINETLGHSVGDDLLRQVAQRLADAGALCVARLGADRFAMAVPGLLDAAGKEGLAQSVINTIVAPYTIGEFQALIGVSVGITDTGLSGSDPDVLMAHADMALSEAKDAPGNSFFVFETELDARVQRTRKIEVALREAIEKGEMRIVYQPQVDLESGEVVGAEALMRWHHPNMGHVSPELFIPVAEDSGLIMEIGRWAMRRACEDAMQWPSPVKLAVNVSALQFEYGDVIADTEAALAASSLPPERLDLEITESVFLGTTEAYVRQLRSIRERGVGVAIDDFGMGYSSLGYLNRLPIDSLKVDRHFVRHLPDDQQSMAIIRSVLTLAESMDKVVVAEGIETADQAWVLRLAGCRLGQGYHFGRPQTQRELCELLALEGPAFELRAIA